MKHFEPDSGNCLPAHPAVCFTSSRLCGTPELCCGPQIGAAERLGSIPARTLIRLGPQSKRFFACLNCVRLMTEALPKRSLRALPRALARAYQERTPHTR